MSVLRKLGLYNLACMENFLPNIDTILEPAAELTAQCTPIVTMHTVSTGFQGGAVPRAVTPNTDSR